MKFEKYNIDTAYSYVFGAFGTIELLNNKSDKCLAIIVDPSFVTNEAFFKIKKICESKNIPLHIDLKIISKIRDKGNIFVVGVFKKYTSLLSDNKHIILNEINDIGVIGTIKPPTRSKAPKSLFKTAKPPGSVSATSLLLKP